MTDAQFITHLAMVTAANLAPHLEGFPSSGRAQLVYFQQLAADLEANINRDRADWGAKFGGLKPSGSSSSAGGSPPTLS